MTIRTFKRKPETITAIQWIDTPSYWDICTFVGMDLTYIGTKKMLEILINGHYEYAEPQDFIVKAEDGTISIMKETDILAIYNEEVTP